MRIEQLRYLQRFPADPKTCWRFFSDPANLRRITPPWLDFQVQSELASQMYSGMVIRYRIRPFLGLPVSWVTEITHVREPEYFVDEQRFGPYRFWHHQHHFREIEGGTEMEDLVHYALPMGALGRLVNRCYVRYRLEEIFAYRRAVLARRFGQLPAGEGG